MTDFLMWFTNSSIEERYVRPSDENEAVRDKTDSVIQHDIHEVRIAGIMGNY